MIVDLLRHGETELGGGLRGSIDDALTEAGWAQMHAAVADAATGAASWTRIVSSPLQRCARFAQVLAERLQLPLSLDADVQELHFGDWEGRSAAQIMQTDADGLGAFWNNPYTFTPPNGEPVAAFAERVGAALQRLQQRHDGERVLLVCHGGVIRLLLARARGLPREQLLQVSVAHGALHSVQVAVDGTLTEL